MEQRTEPHEKRLPQMSHFGRDRTADFGVTDRKPMSSETDQNRRGLMKLMLRMPALRGKLQLVSAANAEMLGLCGAFEEASSTLERLRRENSPKDWATTREYEALCEEIETQIIEMCIR
jgi:hypothetical protein